MLSFYFNTKKADLSALPVCARFFITVLLLNSAISGAGAQSRDTVLVRREIDSLITLGEKLLKSQKFDEAMKAVELAGETASQSFGTHSLEYSNYLNLKGGIYSTRGNHKLAEPLYLESVQLIRQIKGTENNIYASRISNLAAVYKGLGKYDESERNYIEAISIYEADSTLNRLGYSNALNNLSNLYQLLGRYNDAEPLISRAMYIREKNPGKKSDEYATALENMGNLRSNTGNYKEAIRLYKEGLQIREEISGKKTLSYARTLNNLANTYRTVNEFDSAEELLLEANQIRVALNGKENTHYTRGLTSMGMLMSETGRYDEALSYYREALAIDYRLLGEKHFSYANTLHNIAIIYRIQGNYVKAEELYLRVLDLQEKSAGKGTEPYANTLSNLGFLYHMLGQNQAAIKLLTECMNIREQVLGTSHPGYGQSLTDLASVYTQTGQYEKADAYYRKGLPIMAAKLEKNDLEYNMRLSNYAVLCIKTHRPDTAVSILLSIIERIYRSDKINSGYIELLINTGLAYMAQDKKTEAMEYINLSIQLASEYFGKRHPLYQNAIKVKGRYYAKYGAYDDAIKYFREVSVLERADLIVASKHLSESELFQYLNQFNTNCNDLYSLAMLANDKTGVIKGEAYNMALSNKNILSDITRRRVALTESDSTRNLSKNLFVLRRLIEKEMSKPGTERDSFHIEEWEAKANAVERRLVRAVSGYEDLIGQTEWQDIQHRLSPGEAAIEFLSYRFSLPEATDSILYAALLLLPDENAPRFVPLFEERKLKALFNQPGLDELLTVKSLYAPNSDLYQMLWKPLQPFLNNVNTIYYSPAGMLHRINPAALRGTDKQTLSENRQWVQLGSTRELVGGYLADRSFARQVKDDEILTASVWGDITYDMDSLSYSAVNSVSAVEIGNGLYRYVFSNRDSVVSARLRGTEGGNWEPLEGGALEAEQVSTLLRESGVETTLFSGYSASEEHFKAMGTGERSPHILHIATHGFAYPEPENNPANIIPGEAAVYRLIDDPMMRSGLLLAGANHYWSNGRALGQYEDGVLVACEVRDMNLRNTELAVLSACQTGLGDIEGSEGVYGLQRAFRMAGARFMIVSLWHVRDDQTRKLMKLFYENWTVKKESLRDAFTHAQATLRAQEPNPFLWAGFILIE